MEKQGLKTLMIFVWVVFLGMQAIHAQSVELVVPVGHGNSVYSVALSADSKTVASGSWDNTAKIWDAATGKELRTLSGHNNTVWSVALSADGKTVVSGSADKTVKIWDVATGKELRTLSGHNGPVYSVALSADGKTVISGSGDHTVKIWDVATGKVLRTLSGHTDTVESLALSANGKTVASGSKDKTVKIWDIATGKELRTLSGHTDTVWSVALSTDGKTVVSGSKDKTVKIWNIATGKELWTLSGHTDTVESVALSTDGKTVASGSDDHTVKIWDIATGKELRTLSRHTDTVWSVALSADGKTVASGSEDHTVKIWDVATGKELRTLSGHSNTVWSVALSADGKTVASGSDDHTVKIWDIATGKELRTLSGHIAAVYSVALSADGKTVASGGDDNTVKIWDVATGKELRTLSGHSDTVWSVALSVDGKTVASGSEDNTVKIWDIATGKELRTLSGHTDTVWSVALSADGKTVASGSEDHTVKIWDVATGKELRTLSGHSDTVWSVALSADGKTVASGSEDHTVKIWDIATGKELRTFSGHAAAVGSVALSADGKTVVSGSDDRTVNIWDLATGKELRTFAGDGGVVQSVAVSMNGETCIAGQEDGKISFWDFASGSHLVDIVALDQKEWVAIDPDGRFDGSPRGMELLYWVTGMETIDLAQLKERYYEPGLVQKALGYSKEPLREVAGLKEVPLFPSVDVEQTASDSGKVTLKLTNRGGGIGRVQVFVNDSELAADARGPQVDPKAQTATVTVDLSAAKNTIPGQPNRVRIVTWNGENWLRSRGVLVPWTPPGAAKADPPSLYAIVGGISNYSSDHLHLQFAAKDAADMARALMLGADRLFGVEKVHITLLSSASADAPGQNSSAVLKTLVPTKTNFRGAFEEVAKEARPQDILMIYLAGHGVTLGRGSDEYCYLTADARSTDVDALADSAVRAQTAITSAEMADWIKAIAAQKKVVVLDTCSAGAAAAQLVKPRDLNGDQIRAIDRMQERTGLHVLMGSAADAVSYEASQYGQGLLTYALLRGMKGAALREESYVDVSRLFQYAKDEVPKLAGSIGGIQDPRYMAPLQAESFDIGLLRSEDKAQIPLATVRPMVLRPTMTNIDAGYDNLDLAKGFQKRLNDESYAAMRGNEQPAMIYVDSEELPGAIHPTGTYRIEGEKVSVRLVLRRDQATVSDLQVEGTKGDVQGLMERLLGALHQALEKLKS